MADLDLDIEASLRDREEVVSSMLAKHRAVNGAVRAHSRGPKGATREKVVKVVR